MDDAGTEQRGSPAVPIVAGLVLVSFLWALCYPLIRAGLAWAPPLHFAAHRAFIAGAALLTAALLARRPPPQAIAQWLALAAVGVSFTALGFTGMFLAGGRVTPGLATVLANSQPLLAALLGAAVLGERLRRQTGAALVLGFSGIGILAMAARGGPVGTSPSGVLLVLLGALGVAVGNVMLKRLAGAVDPVLGMGVQLLVGSSVLFAAASLLEPGRSVEWSWGFLAVLVTLAVGGTAVAFGLWFWLLGHVELNRANTFTFLTPIFALALGAIFQGERLEGAQWLGALLVVGAAATAGKRTATRCDMALGAPQEE